MIKTSKYSDDGPNKQCVSSILEMSTILNEIEFFKTTFITKLLISLMLIR